jgi:hypothetical protein
MTDIRKWAFVGLMSLGAASIGCASNNNSTGTGGSNGSGGSSSTGSGGSSSTGSGGSSSTGSGGSSSTGSGGSGGAAVGCQMSDAPASATIAEFSSADAGVAAMFGTFVYGDTPKPTGTVGTGSVNVTDTVAMTATAHYQGFGIYFNGNAAGTDCLDGSSYTGIQFDLSGTLTGTGCQMVFSINDAEHGVAGGTDPKPSGPAGSYSPQLAITSSQITSTAMTIKVPFTGSGSPAFSNGAASPATAVDPMKLTGVQWQMAVPAASGDAGGACDWNVNISNVKFYN